MEYVTLNNGIKMPIFDTINPRIHPGRRNQCGG